MSIHFAPQWVKPIKPAGSSATTPTTAEMSPTAFTSHSSKTSNQHPQVPFPALSSGNHQSSVSTNNASNNAPMSYSRATHTPASPGFPTDGSYFPSPDANGTSLNPYPFRYSREQILNLFDEDKVKGTPIELVSLLEQGSVLVAPHANRPIGMRELNETEKKASGDLAKYIKELIPLDSFYRGSSCHAKEASAGSQHPFGRARCKWRNSSTSRNGQCHSRSHSAQRSCIWRIWQRRRRRSGCRRHQAWCHWRRCGILPW